MKSALGFLFVGCPGRASRHQVGVGMRFGGVYVVGAVRVSPSDRLGVEDAAAGVLDTGQRPFRNDASVLGEWERGQRFD